MIEFDISYVEKRDTRVCSGAVAVIIDRVLLKVYHIMSLRTDNSGRISVELRSYKGPPIKLGDGSEIKTGDVAVELHLNGGWFKERHKLNPKLPPSSFEVMYCFAQDLSFLAE